MCLSTAGNTKAAEFLGLFHGDLMRAGLRRANINEKYLEYRA
jgi:hypothetical protein